MRFTLDGDASKYLIQSYGPGWIKVNEREFRQSLIITPEQVISNWPPQTFADLEEAHFESVARLEPEMVLLGTGNRQQFPAPRLTRALLARGVGVEVMNTVAACRTYNIIMLEGRRVVAALLMLTD